MGKNKKKKIFEHKNTEDKEMAEIVTDEADEILPEPAAPSKEDDDAEEKARIEAKKDRKKGNKELARELKKVAKEKRKQDEKNKEKKKLSIKKRILIIFLVLILLAGIGAAVFFFIVKSKMAAFQMDQLENGTVSIDGVVTVYGVISIGTSEETLDIENMTESLVITDVLFESGQTIKAGDAIIKFTPESVAAVEEELTQNLRDADLAYRSGKIEYEQKLITAKYDYDSAILKGEQADEVYKETVASLKSTLQSSKETYEKSVEQLAEYKDAKINNTYYEDYKVEYYKQVYDDNLAILSAKVTEWGVPWEEVTRGMARLGADEYSQYKYVLQSLYSILETNLKDYETALENYENDMADLNYNLLSLQLNMSTLEETYVNAQKSYETNLLAAEETRQTSKTKAELAESEYEATVQKAKTDFESLESKYEDAKADYDTFVACISDNTYHATEGGTVQRTSVRTNGKLSAGGRILTYSDTSEASVTVSVDQSDIAELSVGDSAIIYSSDTGMLNGTITSISPITQSSSISSVTYSVTVRIDSERKALSSNTTVTVMFGDLSNVMNTDLSAFDSGSENSNPWGSGSMPDFGNFGGGSMPDFGGMPNFGQ